MYPLRLNAPLLMYPVRLSAPLLMHPLRLKIPSVNAQLALEPPLTSLRPSALCPQTTPSEPAESVGAAPLVRLDPAEQLHSRCRHCCGWSSSKQAPGMDASAKAAARRRICADGCTRHCCCGNLPQHQQSDFLRSSSEPKKNLPRVWPRLHLPRAPRIWDPRAPRGNRTNPLAAVMRVGEVGAARDPAKRRRGAHVRRRHEAAECNLGPNHCRLHVPS